MVALPLVGVGLGIDLNPVGWLVLAVSDWVLGIIAGLAGL
jgi:hypothetical protein